MKALYISHNGELETKDVPFEDKIAGNEVLLRICHVGFCGSDIKTFKGGNSMALNPVIPGHEIGALIERTGENVPSYLKKGTVVTCNPYSACGSCSSCRAGRTNACRNNRTLGVQRDGAMCEYIILPYEKVIPCSGLTTLQSALIEPMSVGFHAVDRGRVSDNDCVLVIGCGMVGLGAIVRASLRGARVIAADIDDDKLELASKMGAAFCINTRKTDVHYALGELTGGDGPDVVIEAVGSTATYQMAVNEVAFCGRIVCIGYASNDVSLNTRLFVQKEMDILGSRNSTPNDFRAVIRYMQSGECPVKSLVTRTIKPSEALETLRWWSDNPGKVFRIVVDFRS